MLSKIIIIQLIIVYIMIVSCSNDIGKAIVRDIVRVGAQKSAGSSPKSSTSTSISTSVSFQRLLASLRRRFSERRRSPDDNDDDESRIGAVDAFGELEPVFEWAEMRVASREDEDSGGTRKSTFLYLQIVMIVETYRIIIHKIVVLSQSRRSRGSRGGGRMVDDRRVGGESAAKSRNSSRRTSVAGDQSLRDSARS